VLLQYITKRKQITAKFLIYADHLPTVIGATVGVWRLYLPTNKHTIPSPIMLLQSYLPGLKKATCFSCYIEHYKLITAKPTQNNSSPPHSISLSCQKWTTTPLPTILKPATSLRKQKPSS
jgi:hypothetical protein